MKKLRKNLRRYIPAALQIAIGIGLLMVALNMQFTATQQLTEANDQVAGQMVRLSADSPDTDENITYADYTDTLKNVKTSGSSKLIFYKFSRVVLYRDNQAFTVNLYIVDDLFYQYVAGTADARPNVAYAGSDILPMLTWGGFQRGEYSSAFFDEEKQTLYGVDLRDLQALPSVEHTMPPMEYNMNVNQPIDDDYAAFSSAIFLPIGAVPQAMEDDALLSLLYVTLDTSNLAATNAYCADIAQHLGTLHPNLDINYIDFMVTIEAPLKAMRENAFYMQVVAIFVLVIVFLGLVGLLLLIVNRRKRDLAISIICGACKPVVFAELMMEVLGIVSLGAIVGMGFGALITPMQMLSSRPAANHPMAFVVGACITLAIGLCVCLLALATIRNDSPIETVKSL